MENEKKTFKDDYGYYLIYIACAILAIFFIYEFISGIGGVKQTNNIIEKYANSLSPINEKAEITKIVEPIEKADMPDFIKSTFNDKYGVIRISKDYNWLETNKIAEYSLISTSESIIDISMQGKAVLYSDGSLFDDVVFKDKFNIDSPIKEAKFYIQESKDNFIQIPETYRESCNIIIGDSKNNTENKTICENIPDKYKTINQPINTWKLYNGEILRADNYIWKLEAKRNVGQKIDIIPLKEGIEFKEWVWFNTSWNKRKPLYLTNATFNYSYPFEILYNESFKPDYSDLRFTNSSNTELSFWIEYYNASRARIWVRVDRNDTIYMYYNTTSTESKSNFNTTFVFSDDFSGVACDNTIWNWTISCVQGGGVINLSGASAQSSMIIKNMNFSNVYSQIRAKAPATINTGVLMRGQEYKGQEQAGWNAHVYYTHTTSTVDAIYNLVGGTYRKIANGGGGVASADKYTIAKHYSVGSEVNRTLLNASYGFLNSERGTNNTYLDGYIGIFQNTGSSPTTYDYIFVTNWIFPEPTYTLGQEEGGADTIKPSVIFNYQNPADLTSLNVIQKGLNISYNITDETELNISTVNLFYKSNSTRRNTIIFINGTNAPEWGEDSYINYSSPTFIFNLEDNEIYPATYNLEDNIMDLTTHSALDLNNANSLVKIRFFNVSNSTQYNFLEIMTNSSTLLPTSFFYCNSSYTSGSILTTPNCGQFATFSPTAGFNHSHSNKSFHQVIPLGVNISNGQIGNIKITDTSFIIQRGNTGGWLTYYVPNTTETSTIQISNSAGTLWTSQTYTIDAHIHQFSGNSSLYYYVCANDTANNQNCSSIKSDLFDLGGLPPTIFITSPTATTYDKSININYSAISPNGYDIVNYSIYLLNSSLAINQTIVGNTTNLSYIFNSTNIINGYYIISIKAFDSFNQSSLSYSDLFQIDHTPPMDCLNDTIYISFTSYPYVDLSSIWNVTLSSFDDGTSIIRAIFTNSQNNYTIFNLTYDGVSKYYLNLNFTENQNYTFTLYGDYVCPTLINNITRTIYIRHPFNINFKAYDNKTKGAYINNFAYVTAEYQNTPIIPLLEKYIKKSKYLDTSPPQVFLGYYVNGEANLKVYEANKNYTFRILDGSIIYPYNYGAVTELKSYGLDTFIGTIYLNGTDANVEAYLSYDDLHPYRWLINLIFIVAIIIILVISVVLLIGFPETPTLALIFASIFILLSLALRVILWFWKGW